ncbi:hypothetical protein LXL04_029124 [Taraxacum kok-saghyz]
MSSPPPQAQDLAVSVLSSNFGDAWLVILYRSEKGAREAGSNSLFFLEWANLRPSNIFWVIAGGFLNDEIELRNEPTNSSSSASFNCYQLKTLNLTGNFLSGPLPISVFHLPRLEVLDLSSNDFNGAFPVRINLPALRELDFSGNHFHGPIPAGICVNSTGVRVIKLAVNSLNGSIPPEFENCKFLEHLCLASNLLSGAIPEFLFHLPRLGTLDLQYNMFTSITEIGNSSSHITSLDVASNQLFGNLPDFFCNFPNLTHFPVQSNRFSGGIPSSLRNSPAITY